MLSTEALTAQNSTQVSSPKKRDLNTRPNTAKTHRNVRSWQTHCNARTARKQEPHTKHITPKTMNAAGCNTRCKSQLYKTTTTVGEATTLLYPQAAHNGTKTQNDNASKRYGYMKKHDHNTQQALHTLDTDAVNAMSQT